MTHRGNRVAGWLPCSVSDGWPIERVPPHPPPPLRVGALFPHRRAKPTQKRGHVGRNSTKQPPAVRAPRCFPRHPAPARNRQDLSQAAFRSFFHLPSLRTHRSCRRSTDLVGFGNRVGSARHIAPTSNHSNRSHQDSRFSFHLPSLWAHQSCRCSTALVSFGNHVPSPRSGTRRKRPAPLPARQTRCRVEPVSEKRTPVGGLRGLGFMSGGSVWGTRSSSRLSHTHLAANTCRSSRYSPQKGGV